MTETSQKQSQNYEIERRRVLSPVLAMYKHPFATMKYAMEGSILRKGGSKGTPRGYPLSSFHGVAPGIQPGIPQV